MEGVKGLAEFSIHNYDLEGPAEILKENINQCPAHYKLCFFYHFGCVIFFTLNFCKARLVLLSKKCK